MNGILNGIFRRRLRMSVESCLLDVLCIGVQRVIDNDDSLFAIFL